MNPIFIYLIAQCHVDSIRLDIMYIPVKSKLNKEHKAKAKDASSNHVLEQALGKGAEAVKARVKTQKEDDFFKAVTKVSSEKKSLISLPSVNTSSSDSLVQTGAKDIAKDVEKTKQGFDVTSALGETHMTLSGSKPQTPLGSRSQTPMGSQSHTGSHSQPESRSQTPRTQTPLARTMTPEEIIRSKLPHILPQADFVTNQDPGSHGHSSTTHLDINIPHCPTDQGIESFGNWLHQTPGMIDDSKE
ncbi:unnamed protein product [Owenia fusiformis]|uniref:Uncharacterized protein n=1 Tax=Owenia fusiformis TaxID=6347 RepID=A0A8S4NPJ8_OWEFU|nr:unnamed protein product [Owenia fusiformis]